jgi:hypothetical protein
MENCHRHTGSALLETSFIHHAFSILNIKVFTRPGEVNENLQVYRQAAGNPAFLFFYRAIWIFFTAALTALQTN